MELLPLVIAIVSLLATLFTFYLTQLRTATISILIGPEIRMYYADFPNNSTGIYIPTTFINSSVNMGTVIKCGISISKKDTQENYFMLWKEFSKVGPAGNWVFDSQAHSIAIAGKTSITKTVWYCWFAESNPKLHFTEGEYKLVVHIWLGKRDKPKNYEYRFFISKQDEQEFNKRLENNSKKVYAIMLNNELETNKYLLSKDDKRFLKG
ncbi:hypothetical protein [Cyclobacterium jeungdonense]|uniref:Uncharacterized protein n=1 Tax=Cyclobacterium jeungdonense TaxID=708087 RepID=A0ABT8CCI3_9BACT|nr:hypothetical protein [Cyclobacterium jeungdonense]MDN3689460.1 hypothetical protein [Cyclobacterium jeungdonense]